MNQPPFPAGLEHVRTTDTFDNSTVPAGLLRAHRVADGVWGRLVVHTGSVTFVFDDEPDQPITVPAGGTVAIPPARQHHLVLDDPATFAVEFHRLPATPDPMPGTESTALEPERP
ncbi:MAG: DUF1971 domain-containing protein [Acidimicrobiales bacterium]|nr:DUF1971 domain-containing protein [Acidimicrobiales bacterium]